MRDQEDVYIWGVVNQHMLLHVVVERRGRIACFLVHRMVRGGGMQGDTGAAGQGHTVLALSCHIVSQHSTTILCCPRLVLGWVMGSCLCC